MHLLRRADRVLRVGAVRFTGCGAADIDTVAGLPAGHAAPDLIDHAGRVGAWRVGQVGLDRVRPAAHVGVIGVHADGVQSDADLSRSGVRIGYFLIFRTSGPPNSRATIACIHAFPVKTCLPVKDQIPVKAGFPVKECLPGKECFPGKKCFPGKECRPGKLH